MGQYYMPMLTDKNNNKTVYNRDVDGEYTLAKLMEHSWWLNPFVNAICKEVYHNPQRIIWVGDYSDGYNPVDPTPNDIPFDELTKIHSYVWTDESVLRIGVKSTDFTLDDKFLVNHAKKVCLDGNSYYKRCVFDGGWCIHPLPLLTAIGNGFGVGDYHRGTNLPDVGSWANDLISVEDTVPEGYILMPDYCFIED